MGNIETKGINFIKQFEKNNYLTDKQQDDKNPLKAIYTNKFDQQEQLQIITYHKKNLKNYLQFQEFMKLNGQYINEKVQHPNIIQIYAMQPVDKYTLQIYQDFCHTNLKSEIEKRIIPQIFFSSEEIWRTLLSVILACLFLKRQRNQYVGNINTSSIYINQKGVIKLCPYMLSEKNLDNLKAAFLENQYDYLAPESLKILKNNDYQYNLCYYKSDIFGLALTVIEMCTFIDSRSYYDYNNFSLNVEVINQNIQNIKENYGEYLALILTKMTEENPQKRISFDELYEELKQYKESIITGKNFEEIEVFKNNNACGEIIRKIESVQSLQIQIQNEYRILQENLNKKQLEYLCNGFQNSSSNMNSRFNSNNSSSRSSIAKYYSQYGLVGNTIFYGMVFFSVGSFFYIMKEIKDQSAIIDENLAREIISQSAKQNKNSESDKKKDQNQLTNQQIYQLAAKMRLQDNEAKIQQKQEVKDIYDEGKKADI